MQEFENLLDQITGAFYLDYPDEPWGKYLEELGVQSVFEIAFEIKEEKDWEEAIKGKWRNFFRWYVSKVTEAGRQVLEDIVQSEDFRLDYFREDVAERIQKAVQHVFDVLASQPEDWTEEAVLAWVEKVVTAIKQFMSLAEHIRDVNNVIDELNKGLRLTTSLGAELQDLANQVIAFIQALEEAGVALEKVSDQLIAYAQQQMRVRLATRFPEYKSVRELQIEYLTGKYPQYAPEIERIIETGEWRPVVEYLWNVPPEELSTLAEELGVSVPELLGDIGSLAELAYDTYEERRRAASRRAYGSPRDTSSIREAEQRANTIKRIMDELNKGLSVTTSLGAGLQEVAQKTIEFARALEEAGVALEEVSGQLVDYATQQIRLQLAKAFPEFKSVRELQVEYLLNKYPQYAPEIERIVRTGEWQPIAEYLWNLPDHLEELAAIAEETGVPIEELIGDMGSLAEIAYQTANAIAEVIKSLDNIFTSEAIRFGKEFLGIKESDFWWNTFQEYIDIEGLENIQKSPEKIKRAGEFLVNYYRSLLDELWSEYDQWKGLVQDIRTFGESIREAIGSVQDDIALFGAGLEDRITFLSRKIQEGFTSLRSVGPEDFVEKASELKKLIMERWNLELQQAEKLRGEIERINDTLDSLRQTIDRIVMESPISAPGGLGYVRARYQTLLSQARTGDVEAVSEFQRFSLEYLGFVKRWAPGEYREAEYQVLADINSLMLEAQEKEAQTNELLRELNVRAKSTLSVLERLQEETNNQTDTISNHLLELKTQIAQSLDNLGQTIAMLTYNVGGSVATTVTKSVLSPHTYSYFYSYVGEDFSSTTNIYESWQDVRSLTDFFESTFSAQVIPQMASGGIVNDATVALIGEGKNPEAVLPLPYGERTLDVLFEELREIKAENRELRRELWRLNYEMLKSQKRMQKAIERQEAIIEKWDVEGMPQQRV